MLKLIRMMQTAGAEVCLLNIGYGWTCTVEGKLDDTAFKVKGTHETSPSEAVDMAYTKWERITGQLPEFNRGLPPPPPIVEANYTVEDNIPF